MNRLNRADYAPYISYDEKTAPTLDLDSDTSYPVLAINALADLEPLVLPDEQPAVEARDARLRFVHMVPDAPAVDILAGGAPLFEHVAFGASSSYATVEADAYDIDVRPAGSEDSVLDLSAVSVDGATSYTVLATDLLEDNSLDAALVADYVTADADDRPAAAQ